MDCISRLGLVLPGYVDVIRGRSAAIVGLDQDDDAGLLGVQADLLPRLGLVAVRRPDLTVAPWVAVGVESTVTLLTESGIRPSYHLSDGWKSSVIPPTVRLLKVVTTEATLLLYPSAALPDPLLSV